MFTRDFYPTPVHVIEAMTEGLKLEGKTILEPSAGKGNIVDFLLARGSSVITCEKDPDLRKIVQTKAPVIEADFLQLTSDKISHIDMIIMNPPFSADEKHILHAFEIAPDGCRIISLCNLETVKNSDRWSDRRRLKTVIQEYGHYIEMGQCFEESERKTGVEVALVTLNKPGENKNAEFEGFFMDEEPAELGENGIMKYDFIRDLVNRYVEAVKVYDEQLNTAVKINGLVSTFFSDSIGFQCTKERYQANRNEFKKDLQKAGWRFIFSKMNMRKHATRGLMEDINKFVEQQQHIPFTMRNIYRMLEIVIGTQEQRMDKAILEVFDRVTEHHHDNRHNVKGWKTNGHFLVGKKFILPYMINPAKEYGYTSDSYNSLRQSYDGTIPDLEKALCFITGENYDEIRGVNCTIMRNTYGEWYNSHFFRYKGYKNGNMHFEFQNEDTWGRFNQRVAKLKGYPLFEYKKQTAYQERQTGRKTQEKAPMQAPTQKAKVVGTFKLNLT